MRELRRQKTAQEYHEHRNRWAFLAAAVTNGALIVASMFSRRKPKLTSPDDFIDKRFRRLAERATGESRPTDWDSLIADAKAKGLRGPW
ncbi:MAG: hypothetical protein RDU89_07030 [bacterium]|nr:hypothetical protein [bacterium]